MVVEGSSSLPGEIGGLLLLVEVGEILRDVSGDVGRSLFLERRASIQNELLLS